MSAKAVRIVTPMIMSLSASVIEDSEAHAAWMVGYAPTSDENGERFLLAHLHAASDEGRVDVEVAAAIVGGPSGDIDEGESADSFARFLTKNDQLRTLYDLARITARGLLGTIGTRIDLPPSSPPVRVSRLVRADTNADDHPTPQ